MVFLGILHDRPTRTGPCRELRSAVGPHKDRAGHENASSAARVNCQLSAVVSSATLDVAIGASAVDKTTEAPLRYPRYSNANELIC